jgi:hypothetical protein
VIVEAHSRHEVLKLLKEDIYHKKGVWDVENAKVVPMSLSFVRADADRQEV